MTAIRNSGLNPSREVNGSMEADTISKNGRSLKSQMSRGNFLKFIVFFVAVCTSVGVYGQLSIDSKQTYNFWAMVSSFSADDDYMEYVCYLKKRDEISVKIDLTKKEMNITSMNCKITCSINGIEKKVANGFKDGKPFIMFKCNNNQFFAISETYMEYYLVDEEGEIIVELEVGFPPNGAFNFKQFEKAVVEAKI